VLHRHVGTGGIAELLVARVTPRLLSYHRMLLAEGPVDGPLHPELSPVRLRRSTPDVQELHAALAASGEPEVPAFSASILDERFAAGCELWLFHVDGEVAHARWRGPQRVRFGALTVPARREDPVIESVVTLPRFRGLGLSGRGAEHMGAVFREEGARRQLYAINGFNRRYVTSVLTSRDVLPMATVQSVSLGGRGWVKVLPQTDSGQRFFNDAKLTTGRWVPNPGVAAGDSTTRWDLAVEGARSRPYLDPRMGAAKRAAHLDLFARWLPALEHSTVLKTDLWEEAVGGDELLFTLAARAGRAHGVDLSRSAVAHAERAAPLHLPLEFSPADIGGLPLEDSSVDAIVSTSTLDHLEEADRLPAVSELRRVMTPGGTLVITSDNADNVTDGLLSRCARLGLVPFPLDLSVSLDELSDLVTRAGFVCGEHAYLVHGPRVLTTALVRLVRALGGGDRAVDRLLSALDAAGRRAPRKMGAFVALRATAPAGR
jgi:SAM-dependent methyltransferase